MKIRNFIKEDLLQVLDLCREVREYHRNFLDGYFTEQNDEMEQSGFLDSLVNEKITAIVAEDDDCIVGYLLAEEKFAPYLEKPKVMHISNIGVSEHERGKGIGRMLMNKIIEICHAKNMDEIRLGVFSKNTNAYNFYSKFGFEAFEQRMKIDLSDK